MYQGTLEGLWDHAESCQVSNVASLLTEALIHPSAWKVDPAKLYFRFTEFAYIDFAEFRIASVRMLLRAGLLLARQKESPPPFAVVGVPVQLTFRLDACAGGIAPD